MTIKEIAELCGVTEQTVLNWTHKFDESDQKIWSDILEKLANAGHGISADFTLEETLAIIGEGGGNKTLASLLAENAANKNALAKRDAQEEQETEGRNGKTYAEHVSPAAHAANKVYKLQVKYRYTDKVSKSDTAVLFSCATALRRYFYDVVSVNDRLIIMYDALRRKIGAIQWHYNLTDEDVVELLLDARAKLPAKKFASLGAADKPKQITAGTGGQRCQSKKLLNCAG